MRRSIALPLALIAVLGVAAGSWALQTPGRTQTRSAPITAIGLTHASIAFSVGRTKTDCDHVELWNTDTRGTWRFGRRQPCGDLPALLGHRPDRGGDRSRRLGLVRGREPDRLAALDGDADDEDADAARVRRARHDGSAGDRRRAGNAARPFPTPSERDVTWLGENGAAVFRWAHPLEVRAITSGSGPVRLERRRAARDGRRHGAERRRRRRQGVRVRTRGRALDRARAGRAARAVPGAKVEIHRGAATRTVQLKPNAIVLDYAEGRILYRVGQTFWLRQVASGTDTQLLQGSRRQPIVATLDTHGLAWTQGRASTGSAPSASRRRLAFCRHRSWRRKADQAGDRLRCDPASTPTAGRPRPPRTCRAAGAPGRPRCRTGTPRASRARTPRRAWESPPTRVLRSRPSQTSSSSSPRTDVGQLDDEDRASADRPGRSRSRRTASAR